MAVPGDQLLVGCSGGADSVALVHVLNSLAGRLQIKVGVASIDHGLRKESADEVRDVERLAASLQLPFFTTRVCIPSGCSMQSAARAARYDALHELARSAGFSRVAVGHTLDDQAETVLSRLFRSSGVAGLAAIAPVREDGVVRPLISSTRNDVEAYVTNHALSFIQDPSNLDTRFERVRIRRQLAILEEEDSSIGKHLATLADDARECRDAIDAWASTIAVDELEMRFSTIEILPAAIKRQVLFRWIQQHTDVILSGEQQRQLLTMLRQSKGELWIDGDWSVVGTPVALLLMSRPAAPPR